MRSLILTSLLFSTAASAVPMQLGHQGRLLDSSGVALSGAVALEVKLYDASSGGSELWSDSFSTDADAGYFSVVLGSGAALDSSVFAGDDLWVGVTVDGGTELERMQVQSVPFAIRAGSADSAGSVAWDDITGAPVASDTLADLDCSGDQYASYDGSVWACADFAHGHEAGEISGGTLDISVIPVGDSAGQVAAGDHTHAVSGVAFSDLTGAAVVGQLPVGTGSDQVAAGDHSHTAAEIGAVPAGGGIPVGNVTSACDSGAEGTLRYANGALEICGGDAWTQIANAQPSSCKDILAANPAAADGEYTVYPGSSAMEVYCDMTTDGGGWTLMMRVRGSSREHVDNNDAVGSKPCAPDDAVCKLSSAEISSFLDDKGPQILEIRPDKAQFMSWYVRASSDSDDWPDILECSRRAQINANADWRWIFTSYQSLANAEAGVNGDVGNYTGGNHHYPTPYANQQLFFKGSGTGIRANDGWDSSCCNDNEGATLWVR